MAVADELRKVAETCQQKVLSKYKQDIDNLIISTVIADAQQQAAGGKKRLVKDYFCDWMKDIVTESYFLTTIHKRLALMGFNYVHVRPTNSKPYGIAIDLHWEVPRSAGDQIFNRLPVPTAIKQTKGEKQC